MIHLVGFDDSELAETYDLVAGSENAGRAAASVSSVGDSVVKSTDSEFSSSGRPTRSPI